MRFKKFSFIVIACVLLLVGTVTMAGTVKQIGTTGASELLIPVGVRSAALGGANVAGAIGVDAIYVNPAGASVLKKNTEAVLTYQNYLADINIAYVSAMTSLGAFGNLGLSVRTLNFGDIAQTTWDAPEGTGTTFSPSYLTMGVTYGRRFTDRIFFGVNVNVVSEKIMSTSATGVGLDLGLQYVNDATGLRLGVALVNFGTGMKYSGSDLEDRVQLPGTEAGSTPGSFQIVASSAQLPTQLKIGVTYDWDFNEDNLLSISGAFYNNNSFNNQYIAGLEYGFRNMLFLRGSYSVGFLESDEETKFVGMSQEYMYGPAFGAGFVLGAGGMDLRVDYTYRITEFFDDIQMFGFIFSF